MSSPQRKNNGSRGGPAPLNKSAKSIQEIKQWLRMVEDTTREIENGIADFAGYSETYAEMRNKSSDAKNNAGSYDKEQADALKEMIDEAYERLVEVKTEFCALKAGGGRRRARKTRRNK